VARVLRVRNGVGWKAPLQYASKEKTHRRNLICDRSDGQLALVKQMSLILSDVIRAQLIWRLTEVARKTLDGAEVTAYSGGREVTSLEFLQHNFAKMGHRDLLVTHTILLASAHCSYFYPREASAAPAPSFWPAALAKLGTKTSCPLPT
jgi:hypothetical protein